jgi:capsular polysaccharide biosynthesis protein
MTMNKSFTIKEMIDLILGKFWIIILLCFIAGAGTFAVSKFLVTPKYESSVRMIVDSSRTTKDAMGNQVVEYDNKNSSDLIKLYSVVIEGDSVLSPVCEKLGAGYTPANLRKMFQLYSVDGTEVFEIAVTHENAQQAATIANTIAEFAPDEIKRIVKAGSVEIIDNAKVELTPSSPRVLLNTAIGALLGLVLSVVVIFLLEIFNVYIRDEQDLLDNFDYPILGTIPNFSTETR